MVVENFRLVTPIEWVYRRDLPLFDKTLTNPNGTNPILDGEWLMYDTTKKAVRSDGSSLSWVVYAERGRSDTQALGKLPVLYIGKYEADTLIFDAQNLAQGNALMVADVTYPSGGTTRSGLKKQASSPLTIGYVTRMPSVNGQKLRFFNTLT